MNGQDFWRDLIDDPSELILYPLALVQSLDIPAGAKQFLSEMGLPDSAAPFLGFKAPDEDSFPTVANQWGLGDEFKKHAVLGFNGSGDPIAITTNGSGVVVYLNHDNNFETVFMNTSIHQLANCLKAFGELIDKTIEINGEDAFLDNDIPKELQDWIETRITEIDSDAMKENCHWWYEVENLKAGKFE